jgi:hypothetical protein
MQQTQGQQALTNEEGNRIIAEFMNLHSFEDGRYGKMYGSPVLLAGKIPQSVFGDAGLQYHSSWDWLMSVVEKIGTMTNEAGVRYDIKIEMKDTYDVNGDYYAYCCFIYKNQSCIVGTILDTNIMQAVWQSVISFIKLIKSPTP